MENKSYPAHDANKVRWNASANNWALAADSRGIWKECHKDPSLVFSEQLLPHFKELKDKKVCVLGSGDNEAVFAFAGMGAKVTSVDISQKQLDVAAERAKILNLEIDFIQQDVAKLNKLEDESFDLVYTGGHVAVWVSDLNAYYSESSRILKKGGHFIVDEYHPFRRVWQGSKEQLIVGYNYFNRGPFKFNYNDDVLYHKEGSLESFEFHWTLSDIINTMIQSNCSIQEVHEYGDGYEDWEMAPMKGLPEFLLVISRKNA